jgi:hypothetical protein
MDQPEARWPFRPPRAARPRRRSEHGGVDRSTAYEVLPLRVVKALSKGVPAFFKGTPVDRQLVRRSEYEIRRPKCDERALLTGIEIRVFLKMRGKRVRIMLAAPTRRRSIASDFLSVQAHSVRSERLRTRRRASVMHTTGPPDALFTPIFQRICNPANSPGRPSTPS